MLYVSLTESSVALSRSKGSDSSSTALLKPDAAGPSTRTRSRSPRPNAGVLQPTPRRRPQNASSTATASTSTSSTLVQRMATLNPLKQTPKPAQLSVHASAAINSSAIPSPIIKLTPLKPLPDLCPPEYYLGRTMKVSSTLPRQKPKQTDVEKRPSEDTGERPHPSGMANGRTASIQPSSSSPVRTTRVPTPPIPTLSTTSAAATRKCANCGTETSPLWRRGLNGNVNCNVRVAFLLREASSTREADYIKCIGLWVILCRSESAVVFERWRPSLDLTWKLSLTPFQHKTPRPAPSRSPERIGARARQGPRHGRWSHHHFQDHLSLRFRTITSHRHSRP